MRYPIWILVANLSEARLLQHRGPDEKLEVLKEIPHPEGRKREHELVTDRPGKQARGSMKASHGYEPAVSAEQHEAEIFAKHLVALLDKDRAQNHFEGLILIAPPTFLGILRKNLSKPLEQKVLQSIAKDLPARWVSDHELKLELQNHLGLAKKR